LKQPLTCDNRIVLGVCQGGIKVKDDRLEFGDIKWFQGELLSEV
jgi:hypothetical protein